MAKKDKKPAKAAPRETRWTVRGVPVKLQRAAGDAARARGQTLGQWLAAVLAEAVMHDNPGHAEPSWMEAMEQRLARLEAALALDQRPKGTSGQALSAAAAD